MKKTLKQCLLICLSVIAAFLAFSQQCLAADVTGDLKFTVTYKSNGVPVSGAHFDIYLVARSDGNSGLVMTDDFKDYPIDTDFSDSSKWKAAAETLTGYAKRDELTPYDSGETNENGNLTFPNNRAALQPGLYLAVCDPFVKDGFAYTTEPFLVRLPGKDASGGSANHVSAEPKFSKDDIPPSPSDKKTNRKVIKIWRNDEKALRPDSVEIELLKDGEIYDTVILSGDGNWRYEWKNLPEFNADGTKIVWRVTEKNLKDYTVEIEQDGITFTVTNTFSSEKPHGDTTSRKVQKVWDDKGYERLRPKKIKVTLLRNGEAYDTQILTAENGWQYTWQGLKSKDSNGEEYTWMVTENAVWGYTASIREKGTAFVLTNHYNRPILPRTGVLWWPVPVMTALGLSFLIIGKAVKKKRNPND